MQRTVRFWIVVVACLASACTGASETSPASTTEATALVTETTATEPTLPERSRATVAENPTAPEPPARRSQDSAASCVTTPGALQTLIDDTPDGTDVSDMKGKLVNADALGFSVLDLGGTCFENQGTITLEGRYGLWIVRPTTSGSDWVLTDAEDVVLSGLDFGEGSLTITGGQQRIEAGQVQDLTVVGVTDFMMGKMTITGHAIFESLQRVESDKSFARNSDFNTVELKGDIEGFKIENSTAATVLDNTETATKLSLGGLSVQ